MTETVAKDNQNSKRWFILTSLGLFFLIFFLIIFCLWIFIWQYRESTDDAYVRGNLIELTPQIAGTVIGIKADDTDLVVKGQPIIILDNHDTKIALELAETELANTVRQTRQLYNQAAQLKSNIQVRYAEFLKAKADLDRRKNLKIRAVISVEDFQHATDAFLAAKASFELAQHQYSSAQALIQNTQLINYPTIKQASAKVFQAYLNNQRTVIKAPETGFIAKRGIQLGQQIAPGTPLLTIVPLNQIWVEANFKEVQLRHLRIGQKASMFSDVYGKGIEFSGQILGIGAGTGSVFSILPPQNATGNWIKIVQRIPVKISLDPQQLMKYPLRIGLSMNVKIFTKNRKGLMLATQTKDNTTYDTKLFDSQDEVNAMKIIQKIIFENAGSDINRQG